VAAVLLVVCGFYYVKFAHLIDARLGGEQRPIPRIYGRPFDVRAGQALTLAELQERLGDIGYAERPKAEHPGEFSVIGTAVVLMPRATGTATTHAVRIEFARSPRPMVSRLTAVGGGAVERVTIDAPLLSALATGEKRRYVPLAVIPRHMVQAVIAIEDRRFYEHPGVDPIGTLGALVTNIRGNKPYTVGGSTITQQVIKNEFLTPEKTWKRKISEQFMALVLETRLTKDQILELYLNQMIFGQRGPFEIHGVAEASRIFFGKDISNITLAEAATVAGLLQSPSRLSPFRNPERAIERRNLVLKTMVDAGFLAKDVAQKAEQEPLGAEPRALENEAPYFVDYVSQLVDDISKDLLKKDSAVDVYTTIDLHLQRLAQEALADGIVQLNKQLSKKRQGQAQAALVAVDPKTGQILAMVGGRAYNQSQYNRAVTSRRQPGSVFKPFVYLAAFEKMADLGSADLTPATVIVDEPTTFADGDKPPYAPSNYQNEYDGPITLRHALAHSRNIVAIKVAEQTGYDRVAALWNRLGVGTRATPVPSIALGVFEASPLEIATAYSIFPNGGLERPLTAIMRIVENGQPKKLKPAAEPKTIARPETTFLVTNMLRSVLDEGTGAAARANGFTLNAAGKTGTTSDLRDAWFVGFTPELLTVVWVGFDNNQPIGLTGAQAALPMWTTFMKRALAGHGDRAFAVPDGIVFADIDRETGKLATPNCPKIVHEAFLPGTEPKEYCPLHGGGFFGRLGQWLGRIIRR
jgi:penicillin-binding protein 1B